MRAAVGPILLASAAGSEPHGPSRRRAAAARERVRRGARAGRQARDAATAALPGAPGTGWSARPCEAVPGAGQQYVSGTTAVGRGRPLGSAPCGRTSRQRRPHRHPGRSPGAHVGVGVQAGRHLAAAAAQRLDLALAQPRVVVPGAAAGVGGGPVWKAGSERGCGQQCGRFPGRQRRQAQALASARPSGRGPGQPWSGPPSIPALPASPLTGRTGSSRGPAQRAAAAARRRQGAGGGMAGSPAAGGMGEQWEGWRGVHSWQGACRAPAGRRERCGAAWPAACALKPRCILPALAAGRGAARPASSLWPALVLPAPARPLCPTVSGAPRLASSMRAGSQPSPMNSALRMRTATPCTCLWWDTRGGW